MHRRSAAFQSENMQKWGITSSKFLRKTEKPEQLSETLIKLELRIDSIKQVCQTVGKKLLGCLQLHGVEREKRLKKLPESALSKQLHESSNSFEDKEAIRQTLSTCGNVEGDLASMLMSYEDNVELSVLQPLQTLLERDIPAIVKLRKQVTKQAQEVESLKSRHSSRQTVLLDRSTEGTKRATQAMEDMEEAVNKLELYKDQLATEMYNFYAREGELSKIFTYLIESQLKYHSDATVALQKVLPEIQLLEQNAQRPVFGCSLEDHFHLTKQPIASVIRESIEALLVEGIEQEGLFRIAGGATKLKKLKAAFDAGMVEMDEFITDPHCVASALKLYLRELPEPLLTFDLYDDWSEASQLPPDQRVNAIASILKRMKPLYFQNLKYLIQFLSRLADNAEVNKMSPTNLAIVVGPNLLWSRNGDGQNILTTGVQSSIAESMISNAAILFGDDNSFRDRNKSSCPATQFPTTANSSFASKSSTNNNTNNNNNGDNNCVADRISVAAATLTPLMHASKDSNSSSSSVPLDCPRLTSMQTCVPATSSARRFQAQKDFWCRRVDSVSVRSWPERPLVSRRHDARQNSGLAMHESFLRTRPSTESSCGLSLPDDDGGGHMFDFGVIRGTHRLPKVTTLRPSPPKSVHSEMYSTAFALQSLGDVNCADYLAKVRTLWDSHMEGSKKRTQNFDMSVSCQGASGGDARLGVVTTGRQLSLTEGRVTPLCHGLLSQPKLTCSDSELGEMTSLAVSPPQPSGGGSPMTHSRDYSNSSTISTRQTTTMAKVDSSDSLSSDSLGVDSAPVTNQSSLSGSEVFSLSKSAEAPNTVAPNLVAPKRAAKKTQAPLPPGTGAEATAQVTKDNAACVTKTPATSGNHDAPTTTTHQKVAMTTSRAAVAIATAESTSGDSADRNKTTVKVSMATTTQAKVAMATEEAEPPRNSPAAAAAPSNPVTVETGDERKQPLGPRRSNQFAASHAMISNVLSGPRKTLLTRPNTVYMEKAKVELIKTAEEQNEDDVTPSKSNANGAGNSHGKTGDDGAQSDTSPAVQKKKSASVAEEREIGNAESDDEIFKAPSPQAARHSGAGDGAEDHVPKKPERPSKPVRPSQPDVEGGSRTSSSTKAMAADDHSGKEASAVESSSTAKSHESSSTAKSHGESSVGAQSSTGKQPKHPPPEVPHVVQPPLQQPGASGVRPPKPPPPSVAVGVRLLSDTAIEEDTYL